MSVLPFGKFQGPGLANVPEEYRRWLLGQPWLHEKYPLIYMQARALVLKSLTTEIATGTALCPDPRVAAEALTRRIQRAEQKQKAREERLAHKAARAERIARNNVRRAAERSAAAVPDAYALID